MDAADDTELSEHTRSFSLQVVQLCAGLPDNGTARVLAQQLMQSGAAVGRTWRETRHAQSPPELLRGIERGIRELDEAVYWFELLIQSGMVPAGHLARLPAGADDLTRRLLGKARRLRLTVHSGAA